MNIKEKLINEYPLTKKINCSFECYECAENRYVIFYEELISRSNIESLLDRFNEQGCSKKRKTLLLKPGKTLIVVGCTNEQFRQEDLSFCNGDADTFIVYYLINKNVDEIYYNDQWICILGLGWRKIIRQFNEILSGMAKFIK